MEIFEYTGKSTTKLTAYPPPRKGLQRYPPPYRAEIQAESPVGRGAAEAPEAFILKERRSIPDGGGHPDFTFAKAGFPIFGRDFQ